MDFFEHQDRARQKTGQLIALFVLGIAATLVVVNLVCFVGFWLFYSPPVNSVSVNAEQVPALVRGLLGTETVEWQLRQGGFLSVWLAWWHSNLNWQINVGVLAAVLIGTGFRYLELAGGGRRVAEWAGARPCDMTSSDPDRKQFINVCEEMAIAAGMPIPELFVMEREQSINAFVAGYTPDKAVLVVTRGALETLDRDQLQGVIGHEYSHILNGDMRLNVRLMAMLAGLVMIGQIGRFLMASSYHRGHSRSMRSDARIGMASFALGLVFAGVGYIGVLVGRMIKAAVSRQREFLADASSVQFTRNPDGLAGALYAIKAGTEGSQLQHRHAEDMSHFCFGETVALSDRLATHPPVLERIRRISPNFVAKTRTRERQSESAEQSVSRTAPDAFQTALAASGVAAMVGQVTPDHVAYAQTLYRHIPVQMKNWVHQSVGARSFLYCRVMLGTDENQRQPLLDKIKQDDPQVLDVLQKMWPFAMQMDEQLHLPVLELLIPTLKRMTETDQVILLDRLQQLIELDGRVDFTEWVTVSMIRLRLHPKNGGQQKLLNDLQKFKGALSILFSVFVNLSQDPAAAEATYRRTCAQLDLVPESVPSLEEIGFDRLDQALELLDSVSFMWRGVILQGCADIIQSDGEVGFREYEALRIIAECLESPLPVLMIGLSEGDPRDLPIPYTL